MKRTNCGPESLRHRADALERAYGSGQGVVNCLRDAADEIERLRTALDEIWGTLSPPTDLSIPGFDYNPDWRWCREVAARASGRAT